MAGFAHPDFLYDSRQKVILLPATFNALPGLFKQNGANTTMSFAALFRPEDRCANKRNLIFARTQLLDYLADLQSDKVYFGICLPRYF